MVREFKKCACCGHSWESLSDLVMDRQVTIIGYQAAFSNSYEGLFFFSHRAEDCGTTIAIHDRFFRKLYDGPEYAGLMVGTKQCTHLCHSFFDFGECPNECSMRWVRDVIQVLRNRGPEELVARLDEEIVPEVKCA